MKLRWQASTKPSSAHRTSPVSALLAAAVMAAPAAAQYGARADENVEAPTRGRRGTGRAP